MKAQIYTVQSLKGQTRGTDYIRFCLYHQQALCAKHFKCDHVMKPVVKAGNQFYSLWSPLTSFPAWYPSWIWRCSISYWCQEAQSGFHTAAIFLSQRINARMVWYCMAADLAFLVDITKHLTGWTLTSMDKMQWRANCMRTLRPFPN